MGAGGQFLPHVTAFFPRYAVEPVEIGLEQQRLFALAIVRRWQAQSDAMGVIGRKPVLRFRCGVLRENTSRPGGIEPGVAAAVFLRRLTPAGFDDLVGHIDPDIGP